MQIHLLGFCGPPFSGCERLFVRCRRLDDSPSYLQHYINRRVGVKLPQHSLLLHYFAARNLTIAEAGPFHSNKAPPRILLRRKKSFGKKVINFKKLLEIHNQMARVRSTARVDRVGDETEATEAVPISEAMRRSGLATSEDTSAAEAKQADVEEDEFEDEYGATPCKPSHLEFGKPTIIEGDMAKLLKLGYFSEDKRELIRFGGEEVTLKPEKDEVVVFKSFFKAGLRFPLHGMIADVLERFGIHLHQLTPNAIVRLSVYIWALRSQEVEPLAEGFCRAHELHYQTKAREDGLHDNFGCYNFAYRKDAKYPVISYRTKWPAG
jgi:hypothetical protein